MSGAVTKEGGSTALGERPPRAAVVFIVDTEGMMQTTVHLLSDLVKPGVVSCSGLSRHGGLGSTGF